MDQPFMTSGGVIFFWPVVGGGGGETVVIFQIFSLHLEVRMISTSLPPSRPTPSIQRAQALFTRYTRPWRRTLPLPLLQSHTNQPSEGEPLLYLLLRYRPALSPAATLQYAAGRNTRSVHTGRERESSTPLAGGKIPSPTPAKGEILLFSLSLFHERTMELPSMPIRALFATLLFERNATLAERNRPK